MAQNNINADMIFIPNRKSRNRE